MFGHSTKDTRKMLLKSTGVALGGAAMIALAAVGGKWLSQGNANTGMDNLRNNLDTEMSKAIAEAGPDWASKSAAANNLRAKRAEEKKHKILGVIPRP